MTRTNRHRRTHWQGTTLPTLLLAAILLTGCAVEDSTTTTGEAANGEIRLQVSNRQTLTGATRADVVSSNGDLQARELHIDAYFDGTTTTCINNAKLKYVSSAWSFADGSDNTIHYYWPIEGSVETTNDITVGSLDFVGLTPYDLTHTGVATPTYNGSSLSFTCTLPMTTATPGEGETTQANLEEFMWAYVTDQTRATNSGTVNMTFQHPFARINFQLAASHPDITINSITFKNLKTGGNCTFDGSTTTWSALTPAGKTANLVMTLTGDDAIFNSNPASTRQICDPCLVVPQSFTGEITVNATWTDWGEQFAHTVSTTIPTITWAAGTSYTYTFTITETDLKVDSEKFTEQW